MGVISRHKCRMEGFRDKFENLEPDNCDPKTGSQLSGSSKFFTVFSLANQSKIDLKWSYTSTFFEKYNFQTENLFQLPSAKKFQDRDIAHAHRSIWPYYTSNL